MEYPLATILPFDTYILHSSLTSGSIKMYLLLEHLIVGPVEGVREATG